MRCSCSRASGRSGCAPHDNSTAVADGLAVTGRIITAAAAIMFCVFGSFVIKDPLHILKVFGLGLAVAVLIDVTLVRMVLVPSIMETARAGQLVDAEVPPALRPHHRRGGHSGEGTDPRSRLRRRAYRLRNAPASLDPCRTNRSR